MRVKSYELRTKSERTATIRKSRRDDMSVFAKNTSPSSVQVSRAASQRRTCGYGFRRWIRRRDVARRVCTGSPLGFDATSIADGADNCLNCDFNMISMITGRRPISAYIRGFSPIINIACGFNHRNPAPNMITATSIRDNDGAVMSDAVMSPKSVVKTTVYIKNGTKAHDLFESTRDVNHCQFSIKMRRSESQKSQKS